MTQLSPFVSANPVQQAQGQCTAWGVAGAQHAAEEPIYLSSDAEGETVPAQPLTPGGGQTNMCVSCCGCAPPQQEKRPLERRAHRPAVGHDPIHDPSSSAHVDCECHGACRVGGAEPQAGMSRPGWDGRGGWDVGDAHHPYPFHEQQFCSLMLAAGGQHPARRCIACCQGMVAYSPSGFIL
jgi:hypothetical protein